jgi:hypothetical protein
MEEGTFPPVILFLVIALFIIAAGCTTQVLPGANATATPQSQPGQMSQPTPGQTLPPKGGLKGNSNYMLYDGCQPLQNLSVTIDVTKDMICKSTSAKTTSGAIVPGSMTGFSVQLNGYSAPGSARVGWQQYGFTVDTTDDTTAAIYGWIDNWPDFDNPYAQDLFRDRILLVTLPTPELPAGYRVTISLGSDDTNNINSVAFLVVDNHGNTLSSKTIDLLSSPGVPGLQLDVSSAKRQEGYSPGPVTRQDLAPINAAELNIVAPSGEDAILSSGAGTITYVSDNGLAPVSSPPACMAARTAFTAENANTIYGVLPAGSGPRLTQSFGVNTSVTEVT